MSWCTVATPLQLCISPTKSLQHTCGGAAVAASPKRLRAAVDSQWTRPPGQGFTIKWRLQKWPRNWTTVESRSAVVALLSSWLLAPVGASCEQILITVQLKLLTEMALAIALRGDPMTRHLNSSDVWRSGYTVFGQFDAIDLDLPASGTLAPLAWPAIQRGQSRHQLVLLDGELKMSRAEVANWVRDTALAAADFYHRFPVSRSL